MDPERARAVAVVRQARRAVRDGEPAMRHDTVGCWQDPGVRMCEEDGLGLDGALLRSAATLAAGGTDAWPAHLALFPNDVFH
jgi:hypothetical protein